MQSQIYSLILKVIFNANGVKQIFLMHILRIHHLKSTFSLLLFYNTLQIRQIFNTSYSKLCFSFQTLHQLLIYLICKVECKILRTTTFLHDCFVRQWLSHFSLKILTFQPYFRGAMCVVNDDLHENRGVFSCVFLQE